MRSRLTLATTTVFVLILTLVGCDLYNTKASTEEDKAAKTFTLEADKSVIYVYRSSSLVAVIQAFRIYLDGRAVVDCTSGTFIRLVVDPGTHKIGVGNVSSRSLRDSIEILTEKGEIYYIELTIGANVMSGVPELKSVEIQTAQKEIEKCSLLKLDD